MAKGIDVSKWNGEIDWKKLKRRRSRQPEWGHHLSEAKVARA